MKKSIEEIVKTEAEYWNENKLDRRKIKKLRRHAFYYSYKREAKIINNIVATFEGKELLEIGSHSWMSWIKNKTTPKKITCINISEVELQKGAINSKSVPFEIDFHLMDANNLTFPDASFDIVYGGAILHHLDIEKSVNHIHRVLKPDGYILFTEPLNINPLYKIYRKFNPKERTPDEHALVSKDFKLIRDKFTFDHYFFDFFSVIFGFIALKIYGDKNYNNWINKFGYNLDVFFSKIPFLHFLFARVIIYGKKK
ncbi:methyltransferase family protein [Ulvibacter sp. MAR_2010_11]|uniref:class I SAM-dependent methyltransferase n=1 Tax=Ulvibacter sp. MAR_2010_11 TaxID=1250229 RepID=UPI000C2B6436|nr:class I SAM-dependent methyltransferase [Ulvibacter sp. MAR_2010_11]PKA84106.1 methyltransferase family protein [Ulvibacter sp. MAR_2010_11]